MAHEELLARTEFFSVASPDVLRTIAAAGHERNLIRGDVLFHENDTARALYVVIRGRLAQGRRVPTCGGGIPVYCRCERKSNLRSHLEILQFRNSRSARPGFRLTTSGRAWFFPAPWNPH